MDENSPILSYELRDGITYDQIGIKHPSDATIKAFLEANPNRKSLFKVFPVLLVENNEIEDDNVVDEQ